MTFKKFNILLILTDGDINDMQETINELKISTTLPVSVIIVGVGNDKFEKMHEIDNTG